MKLSSKKNALDYIEKELNFRHARESNGSSGQPNGINYTGKPRIIEEKSFKGIKAWKYEWPEEDTGHWLLQNGRGYDEEDLLAEMDLLSSEI